MLNTHKGQIICRGHPRPRTRTRADYLPDRQFLTNTHTFCGQLPADQCRQCREGSVECAVRGPPAGASEAPHEAPRTRTRGRFIATLNTHAEHAAGADLLSWPRGGLCARLNTHKGQVYCHLEQVRRGRQQGGDGPLNTHEHARSIPHEHARMAR